MKDSDMPLKKALTKKEKDLMRRYLIWCYKTTKEELDKVDRYFTQLQADDFVLRQLKKSKDYKSSGNKGYKDRVDQFKVYMEKKEANVLSKKFCDNAHKTLSPDYQYLKNRFLSIEDTIAFFLGDKVLKEVGLLYEKEMTGRILQAREHA